MPSIANFYGIAIYMYRNDSRQHHLPHVHAIYQDHDTAIAIEDCRVLEGKLPPGKLRLALAWVELHRDELLSDWELAVNQQTLFKIKPLE